MKRRVSTIIAALLLALPVHGSAGELPDWLTGEWVQKRDDRTGRGEKLQSWEVMRIVRAADGSLAFHGAPEGGPATIFPAIAEGVRDISFANPAHDYPQRIRYWREGRLLMAETANMDGSRAQNWTYAPAGE